MKTLIWHSSSFKNIQNSVWDTSWLCFHILWRGWITQVVTSLVTRTEMVLKILIYSPYSHWIQLLAWEYFIQFSHHYNFRFLFTCYPCPNTPNFSVNISIWEAQYHWELKLWNRQLVNLIYRWHISLDNSTLHTMILIQWITTMPL